MNILDYVVGEGLVMIPFLMVLAYIIKNTGFIKNELIPLILLAVSILVTPWFLGGYNAANIVQAVLVVGGAVLTNQTYKQIGYLKDGDKTSGDDNADQN